MTTPNKISIVVPIYNVENYIEACIDSIIQQDYPYIECLLINDCTPDNSMNIINNHLKNYKGTTIFKIINHDSNLGLSAARNTGVKNATGKYIYFLDSDDELYSSNSISTLAKETELYPQADFIVGNIQLINSSKKSLSYNFKEHKVVSDNIQILNDYIESKLYMMAWNKLINKDFFIKNQLWFLEGHLHEDERFSLQLASCAQCMVYSTHKTYKYKIRATGAITSQVTIKHILDSKYIVSENTKTLLQHNNLTQIAYSDYIITSFYHLINKILSPQLKIDNTVRFELLMQTKKDFCNLCQQHIHPPFKIKTFIKYIINKLPISIHKLLFQLK